MYKLITTGRAGHLPFNTWQAVWGLGRTSLFVNVFPRDQGEGCPRRRYDRATQIFLHADWGANYDTCHANLSPKKLLLSLRGMVPQQDIGLVKTAMELRGWSEFLED